MLDMDVYFASYLPVENNMYSGKQNRGKLKFFEFKISC